MTQGVLRLCSGLLALSSGKSGRCSRPGTKTEAAKMGLKFGFSGSTLTMSINGFQYWSHSTECATVADNFLQNYLSRSNIRKVTWPSMFSPVSSQNPPMTGRSFKLEPWSWNKGVKAFRQGASPVADYPKWLDLFLTTRLRFQPETLPPAVPMSIDR